MSLSLSSSPGRPSSAIGKTWDATGAGLCAAFTGPWAQLASLVSLGWLATILYLDAVISPAGTGLLYAAAGTITFFSTFSGRTGQTHTLGVWTSMGVSAVFSVAISFWAINVALPGEVIQRMVDEVVVPEGEDVALEAGH